MNTLPVVCQNIDNVPCSRGKFCTFVGLVAGNLVLKIIDLNFVSQCNDINFFVINSAVFTMYFSWATPSYM